MFSKGVKLAVIVAITSIPSTKAHSWVHCSDYRGDTKYYEQGKCFGHPRSINGRVPDDTQFGTDIGYDEQPGMVSANVNKCQVGVGGGYKTSKPMARYRPGQSVTLAWPTKNHVAADCTNANIPDTSLKLFVAPFDASGHPTEYTQVKASFSDDPHVKGQKDFKGFQNCPAVCENMDKSLCTGTFLVPGDLENGVYTFQWNWVFNAGSPAYITCFEAYVGDDVKPVVQPTPKPTEEGQTPEPSSDPTVDPNADCKGMYDQCAGGLETESCCVTGTSCFKQGDHYSQCLSSCPANWECDTSTGSSTSTPQSAPTQNPILVNPVSAEPTAAPATPTASPTAAVTTADGCTEGYGFNGMLQKPSGASPVSASLESGCNCAKFCTIFAPDAKLFQWKKGKCACFAKAKKIKKKKNATSKVGTLPLDGFVCGA